MRGEIKIIVFTGFVLFATGLFVVDLLGDPVARS